MFRRRRSRPRASSSPDATADAGASAAPSGSPADSPAPSSSPTLVDGDVAIVPVTNFRTTLTSVKPIDVRALVAGGHAFDHIVLVEADADAVLAALKLPRAALGDKLVTVATPAAVSKRLANKRRDIGFLRADDVGPSVRALGWGSKSMFGEDRVATLDDWPLQATLPVASDASPGYDPAHAWTMVAGGDILLDRGVKLAIDGHAAGTDFPFNGGTAEITGTCKNCSPLGWDTPYTKRTGNAGAFRSLTKGADVAIANFENPAPNTWRFHPSGTVFSANPANIAAVEDAGFDWVSMANNHIGDAGDNGILQTMKNLDKHDIAHSGAGKNLKDAHKASMLKVGGVTVGLLGYDTIAPTYWATADSPGSAHMTVPALKKDVAAARAAGADVVVVMPHWGVEYTTGPTAAAAEARPGGDRRRGRHGHRQPSALGGRDGGLQGQPDLVRARQPRVRPDLVHPDPRGDHARAHVRRQAPRPGEDPAPPDPRPSPAELHGPGRRRQGRAQAALPGVGRAAALVTRRRR